MTNVKFTGILKLTLDEAALASVRTLWTTLPSSARPLAVEDLHVTLIHQRHLKPFKSFLSGFSFPEGPSVKLGRKAFMIKRPDRTSWIALIEDQKSLQEYVHGINEIMLAKFNMRIDENRVFHVSLANMDGNPFASVGDVNWDDVGGLNA